MKLFATFLLSGALSVAGAVLSWLPGGHAHQALAGPPGAAHWIAAVAAVAPGLRPPDPVSASPAEVGRFFTRLTDGQRWALAHSVPGVVGNLDGAPLALRYAANELAAARSGGGFVASPLSAAGYTARYVPGPEASPSPIAQPRLAWGSGGRLLTYDPRGDGRIVEVFGDLATARHIAVIVPGSGWDLTKIRDGGAGTHADPVAAAAALRAEAYRLRPTARTAVVVWLGYDAPEGIDMEAARSERAVAGSGALARFLRELPSGAHVTLIGHSYGTVVCGHAVASGTRVDDLVALASPGMDVDSRRELAGARRVWAATVATDPIRLTPYVRVEGFGHRTDPTSPGFGALTFGTGTAEGHGGYFEPDSESLVNLTRIMLGRAADVTP